LPKFGRIVRPQGRLSKVATPRDGEDCHQLQVL
jgi:hypothetical protein